MKPQPIIITDRIHKAFHQWLLNGGHVYVNGQYRKKDGKVLQMTERNTMNKHMACLFYVFLKSYLYDGREFIERLI